MDATTHTTSQNPRCQQCANGGHVIKWGKDSDGHQRYRCTLCRATFANRPVRPLGSHRIPLERGLLVLNLLTEGSSIRAIERVTGTHRDTICRLLRTVGDRCADFLDSIKDVEVKDVQADELWGFVGMKQKTKNRKQLTDPEIGDAWCFVAIERESKFILSHHLGQRTGADAETFVHKLARSISSDSKPQLSTDGLSAYITPMVDYFDGRGSYGQLIKYYGEGTKEDQRRYSPASIIGTEKVSVFGKVEEARICTSHVERSNLTIRTHMRRLTRLTCAFSKKWENLRAAFALHFASYNFVKFNRSIRMTPAMKAGVTHKPWSIADLVMATA
jgi:transposase-like protein/IS1 family transposase